MRFYAPLSALGPGLRRAASPVLMDPADNAVLTWQELFARISSYRNRIRQAGPGSWALRTDDPEVFLPGLLALWAENQEVHLTKTPWPGSHTEDAFRGDQEPSDIPWESLDMKRLRVVLHTSGSTGHPKMVYKSLVALETELAVLAQQWTPFWPEAVFHSTVSSLHLYGFLFASLLPLVLGCPMAQRVHQFPESLVRVSSKAILITSPAFLKRWESSDLPPSPGVQKIFSSGGFLAPTTAAWVQTHFKQSVTEIYGSTETGGIAHRESPNSDLWKPFCVVNLSHADEDKICLDSPYLWPESRVILEDVLEGDLSQGFILLGRGDSVVKIEEKRVSLNEVSNHLHATGLLEDVVVIPFQSHRQYLGAVLVLNARGRSAFVHQSRKEMTDFFKSHLKKWLEPVVIPRKWRFLDSLPRNSQGKISLTAVKGMFETDESSP